MHGLEMPDALARLRVQRDDGAAVEIVAETVAAVHVVRDARGRHVDEPELVVDAECRPDVAGARVAPSFVLPCRGRRVALARHGAPSPALLAGAHVERTHVAG